MTYILIRQHKGWRVEGKEGVGARDKKMQRMVWKVGRKEERGKGRRVMAM